MAVEKLLNTRIQLKYDTLANWNNSTVVLKAGELAIVTLGSNKDGSVAGAANQHPVLFKVGNNEKTFKDLPFASALAADVYAWAKAENVQLSGKTIQFVNGETVVKSVVLDYITESEVKEILKGYYTKTEVDTLLAGVKTAYETYADGKASAAETAAKNHSDANLVTAKGYTDAEVLKEKNRATGVESGFETRIGNLETAIGENGSVATQISNAIAALDSSATHAAGNDGLALSVELVDGKVTAISGSIAAETYDAYGSAAAAQSAAEGKAAELVSGLENGQVKTNKEAIAGIKNGTAVNDFAAAEVAIADAKKAGTDANTALETYKTSNDAAVALKAAQADLEAEIDRATKAEQANAAAIELLTNGVDQDKVDGVKDLIDYVEKHGPVVIGMKEDIADNAEAIAKEIKDRGDAVQSVQDQINALGITDGKVTSAATADVANSLSDSAKAEVKGVKVDAATNADEAAHAVNADKLGDVVAANYALKTDAQDYANTAETNAKNYAAGLASNYATAAQGAKADSAVQPGVLTETLNGYYTKTEADAEFMNATETDGAIDTKIAALKLAENYEPIGAETRAKAYADGLAGNYATAAQGAKADSALQEVAVGTGLKVSAKADNKQTIEIDTDVVFVFNCGSSTEVI